MVVIWFAILPLIPFPQDEDSKADEVKAPATDTFRKVLNQWGPGSEGGKKVPVSEVPIERNQNDPTNSETQSISQLTEKRVEGLKRGFDQLLSAGQYFDYREKKDEIFESMASSKENLDLLITVLLSTDEAARIFQNRQAEARLYGIQLLGLLHKKGDSSWLEKTIVLLAKSNPTSVGQQEDLKDMISAYIKIYSPAKLFDILPIFLQQISYAQASVEIKKLIRSIIFEFLSLTYFEKTNELLDNILGDN